ncbi:MauE/DoxX family redox-associated membrane protein [Gordonia sp. Z-3]|jgi:uncharacterized membrane protein|uniref:DoxX family protein n=1 Tax=unclassified Gordonia (in: high G+C Gram-positive bacteria) TaxID=2657482 RepID=UPI000C62E9F1|nr:MULTISPECIES: MauE/DoxX family redox-associated membrane protein [unclassified Gordonia (in: high G+C Gram-positive bacteria)]MAU82252.1 hypothetical protein [Gordonia sp. (in: high G+C Gram-positive bacteria)]MED5799448.1 MauE/DoxX family redox-associated membrane protein [Gordonia sp. Z-3]
MSPDRLARLLAGMLLSIGAMHFVAPKPFDDIIPEEIPADPRTLTYASGVAEVAIGAGLLAPRTRRVSAALAAALFVAVYPANLNMVRLWKDKPLPMRAVAIARLPFQFPMIWAAVKVFRGSR